MVSSCGKPQRGKGYIKIKPAGFFNYIFPSSTTQQFAWQEDRLCRGCSSPLGFPGCFCGEVSSPGFLIWHSCEEPTGPRLLTVSAKHLGCPPTFVLLSGKVLQMSDIPSSWCLWLPELQPWDATCCSTGQGKEPQPVAHWLPSSSPKGTSHPWEMPPKWAQIFHGEPASLSPTNKVIRRCSEKQPPNPALCRSSWLATPATRCQSMMCQQ